MSPKYIKKDTNYMPYEEFGTIVDELYSAIINYCEEKKIKFNAVAPIMRSGGIFGSIMAVRLGIDTIYPIQWRGERPLKSFHYKLPRRSNILICENNTDTGTTAKKSIALMHDKFPKAKLYYATVTRVYGGPTKYDNTEEYFCGVETDERFQATKEDFAEKKIRPRITIFPWESLAQELEKINNQE